MHHVLYKCRCSLHIVDKAILEHAVPVVPTLDWPQILIRIRPIGWLCKLYAVCRTGPAEMPHVVCNPDWPHAPWLACALGLKSVHAASSIHGQSKACAEWSCYIRLTLWFGSGTWDWSAGLVLCTSCGASHHFHGFIIVSPPIIPTHLTGQEDYPLCSFAPCHWLDKRGGAPQWAAHSANQQKQVAAMPAAPPLFISWWAARPGHNSHEEDWLTLRSQHFFFSKFFFPANSTKLRIE